MSPLAFARTLICGRAEPCAIEPPAPIVVAPILRSPRKDPSKDSLGPKQIAWLEEKFRYFGVYRQQALAAVGTAPTSSDSHQSITINR